MPLVTDYYGQKKGSYARAFRRTKLRLRDVDYICRAGVFKHVISLLVLQAATGQEADGSPQGRILTRHCLSVCFVLLRTWSVCIVLQA